MEIYKIAIWTILLLGIGHSAFTFKKYKQVSAEALWFFSASLGLVFNGLLNYINLNVSNNLISNLTIGANAFQTIFFIVLFIPFNLHLCNVLKRYTYSKCCTFSLFTVNLNGTMVLHNYFLSYGQTKTCSSCLP